MSKLYTTTETDAIRTIHTARGHKSVLLNVYYGSRSNSKLAAKVNVFYPKDSELPVVFITTGKDLIKELWSEC